MTSSHARLLELALGELDGSELEAAEREILASPALQRELAAIGATLSELAHAAPPLQPDPGLRARLLSSIDPASPCEGFVARLSALFDLAGDRVRAILRSPEGAWVALPPLDVALLHFAGGPRVAGCDCGLVRIGPGVEFPRHRHTDDERALILSGRAREDTGVIWRPGDLVHTRTGEVHSFRNLDDEPFVFAVVLDGPIELT